MSELGGTPQDRQIQGQPEILSSHPGSGPVLRPDEVRSSDSQPVDLDSTLQPADILAAGLPAPTTRTRRTLIAAGAGVVVVAAIGTGAAFAAGAFGGGNGDRPEQYVPASAVGFVSVDLDPSLGQKVDALRFLRKFPSARKSLSGDDDIRQWIFGQAAEADPALASLDYATDVLPWIGDRFGLAVLPPAKSGSSLGALVVLQVTDDGQAQSTLKKLTTGPGGGTCSVSDGYAVCAATSTALSAARAEAAQHPLADDATFAADVKAIGPRGIALAWGNPAKFASVVASGISPLTGAIGGLGALSGSADGAGSAQAAALASAGRYVATLRFDGANLEFKGQQRGTPSGPATGASSRHGTGIEQLPADTIAALGTAEAAGVADGAYASVKDRFVAIDGGATWRQVQRQIKALGFTLPGDLKAVLGTKVVLAYGGFGPDQVPRIGIRSDADPQRAGAVLASASAALAQAGAPFRLHQVPAGSGYAAALDESYANLLAVNGELGSSPEFRQAVPDAASDSFVMYLDPTRLLSSIPSTSAGDGDLDATMAAIAAIGLSTSNAPDGAGVFDVRVITR